MGLSVRSSSAARKMMKSAAVLLAAFVATALGKSVSPLYVELPSEGVSCFSNSDCLSSEVCEKKHGESHGSCMFQSEPTDADLQAEMGAQVLTAAGLNVSALTINAGPGKESKIKLGDGPGSFTLAIDADGTFVIRAGSRSILAVDRNG